MTQTMTITPSPIPLVDLRAQLEKIRPEIDQAIQMVLDSCHFIEGQQTRDFENEFAKTFGIAHGVGCDNGTAALFIALLANQIGPGDEVITVANTFIATASAIAHTGAQPVLVDVDP